MTVTLKPTGDECDVVSTTPSRLAERWNRSETPDKACVAGLSAASIDRMSSDELARVILASGLPSYPCFPIEGRLRSSDRETLRRLAYLARRCCRNQGY